MNWKTMLKFPLLATLLLAFFLIAGAASTHAATPGAALLQLDVTGLEDLGPGWAYEGWVIVDGNPLSTGVFTVDGTGNASVRNFAVNANPQDVSAFVLTIEPSPDPDPAPSNTHLLGGDFNGRFAHLTVGHHTALGNDFLDANGSFILAVPSDSSGNTPYTHGIWWLNPAGPTSSLDLPTLPTGWAYEGWVVGANGPISTGVFTDLAMADSDAGGPYAGPDNTPPFPGQDFVNPPMDLTGLTAVISIEPSPDNSPAPFTLKPLIDGHIDDLGAPGLAQEMDNNAAGFPSGTAKLLPAQRYQVTFTNLTAGQPLSPAVVATHRAGLGMFNGNQYALPALEAIAEDGDESSMAALLNSLPQVSQVVQVGAPLTPQGITVGDFSSSATFEIIARPGDRISLASMLICTNDGFTALGSASLPQHGSHDYWLYGYDAGTEDNTELSGDLPDPCSALGPVVLNGDANGNENTAVDTQPHQSIQLHPGIQGNGDLLPAHNWDGAVAKVTITRLDN
ncbi:MAG: spondin domain-containing protein [Chloroflexota bacterium]